MKQVLSYIISGVMGGLLVFVLIQYTHLDKGNEINQLESSPILTNISNKTLYPAAVDFVKAAEISTPAVVHIKAEESEALAQQRYQDNQRDRRNRSPFDDFFELQDFFDMDIFRQPFHRQRGSGSGVIISGDGYIVTNNHVIEFADNIIVTINDGREFKARKIGTDPSTDVAVIKVDATNLPKIEFGNSDDVHVGEWVLAVGNPFDYLRSTVTAGIISAKGRDIDIIQGQKAIEEFIQTDAAINPGNSGGALVNVNGQIIGLNTAIATPTGVYAGYSFAIPSNLVSRIVEEIVENGDIERANLGIYGIDINLMKQEGEELDSDRGVFIDDVINGSSAQYAGLVPSDIIVGIDGKRIDDFEDLKDALKFAKVGDTLRVKVIRNGVPKTIPVKLMKGI